MRILMVNKFLYPNGGSETYIFKLGEYLVKQGHKVEYFGMEHPRRCVANHVNAYTETMDFHNAGKLTKMTYPLKTIYSREAREKIHLVLEDFKPDVVHINNYNFQLTPSILLEIDSYRKKTGRKVRIIATAHDYQVVCPNHMMYRPEAKEVCDMCLGGKYSNCFKKRCIHGSAGKSAIGTIEAVFWNTKRTYRLLDQIICPSQFMKSKIDTNPLLCDKTMVLYNFTDEVTNNNTKKLDYILYFGRFSEEKGIHTLLQVCKKLPKIPFVFAGSGPLEDCMKGINNVKNVGFQHGNKLQKLIQEARLTIYPSEWYENCPFSIIESQMYGTPVIGARIGGIPELIQDGVTGRLFESGNADDLQSKIEEVWKNKEILTTYSMNCKAVHFDTIAEYVEQLIKIYAGVE